MTGFDPAAALVRYHEALNALDWAALDAAFADNAVYQSAGVGALTGKAAILAGFRAWFANYPDQIAADDEVAATGAFSARAIWRLTATHAATGERLARRGAESIFFDGEGRILSVDVSDEAA